MKPKRFHTHERISQVARHMRGSTYSCVGLSFGLNYDKLGAAHFYSEAFSRNRHSSIWVHLLAAIPASDRESLIFSSLRIITRRQNKWYATSTKAEKENKTNTFAHSPSVTQSSTENEYSEGSRRGRLLRFGSYFKPLIAARLQLYLRLTPESLRPPVQLPAGMPVQSPEAVR